MSQYSFVVWGQMASYERDALNDRWMPIRARVLDRALDSDSEGRALSRAYSRLLRRLYPRIMPGRGLDVYNGCLGTWRKA
jgi:hypothetical protein